MASFIISAQADIDVEVGQTVEATIVINGIELQATLLCDNQRYVKALGVYHPEGFYPTSHPYYEYHFMTVGEFT